MMGIELKDFLFEGLLNLLKGAQGRRKRVPEYAYVASMQGNSISSLVQADDRWKSCQERMVLQSPTSLIRSHCGRFLYAASSLTGRVSAFRAKDGESLVRLNSHSSDEEPESMAVCPAGRFLYVANSLGSSVSVFATDRNGLLSPPTSYPTRDTVHDVACHPKEPLLCLCHKNAGTLTFVSVTEEDGLSEVAVVDAGTEPSMARW
ncbi:MAG: beta-propeller fold lactonase family protein, partial [Candidatus Eremiobacteraeota bacterium]|nr:beta-propeller fold lactonase family protein [Candidatus Eremiobacteraeota bacterium]